MTPSQKAVWLTALRSGNFKQSRHSLKDNEGYCCLGVANEVCNLRVVVGDGEDEYLKDGYEFVFLPKKLQHALATANDGYTTQSVISRAFNDAGYLTHPELAPSDPAFTDGYGNPHLGASFAAIADWIDKNVQPDEVDHHRV